MNVRSLLLASAVNLIVSSALADDASTGIASFYSGRPYQGEQMTAAHRSLAFGTKLRVRRVDNSKRDRDDSGAHFTSSAAGPSFYWS